MTTKQKIILTITVLTFLTGAVWYFYKEEVYPPVPETRTEPLKVFEPIEYDESRMNLDAKM